MTKTVIEVFWYKVKFATNNPSVRLKPAAFPFMDGKRAAKEILFGKIEKSQILITQSINFIQKNAMKLHFTESFAQAFREPQR